MSKKKIDAALKEFQDSMGYDDGIIAKKRGGYMRYGNKFATGSVKNYGYQNVIEEEVEEPELDALIEQYKRRHPFAKPWGEQNLNALAGAGLSALNQAQQSRSYDSYMKGLRKQSDVFNVTDNDALLSWDANNPILSQSRVTDFRNKSWWDDTKSALSTGLSAGMATANPLVGLGAAGLSFLGSLAGRGIAAYNSKKANEAIDDLNYQRDINFSKAGDNVDAANDLRRMMAYANRPFEYALGGEMRSHGQTWNNGLTFINEGGTHEENPLEGVPSGVDSEGTPNLVEEGEVIWNNEYVFSNRLKVPEELKKKYKLGGDLTFADAIKKVTKESLERPNDPISNETNRAITNEFMDAQEALREEQQAKAARNLQRAYDEDFMEQLAMLGQPEAPMMGQGIQMPQQETMQEGVPVEGAPIGFDFGGNKKRKKELEKQAKEAAKDAGILTKEEQNAIKIKQLQDKINSLFSPTTPSTINDFLDALFQGRLGQPQVPQTDSTGNYIFPKIQAFGGNKFDNGSWKQYYTVDRDENGATIYIAPDGQAFYSENGAERYARLNSDTWVAPANITEDGFRAPSVTGGNGALGASIGGGSRGYRPDNLPEGLTPIYSRGANGNQGRVHHYETSDGRNVGSDVNRAIQAQLAINNRATQRNVTQVSSPERTTARSSTTNRNPRNVSSEPRQSTAQRTQFYNTTTPSRPTQQPTPTEPTQTTNEVNENATTNRVFQVDQDTKGARAVALLRSLGINPNIEGLTGAEVENLARRVAKVYNKERKKADTLTEGSPKYNEVMQSALSAARDSFREESAKLSAERSAARKATEESLAKTQREVDAKKYLENRGYTAQSQITKEDRQIYKDILNGKRSSDGSIRKPSQQQTSSQSAAPTRYPVSTFDNRITEGNYPETFGIGDLNDVIEQSAATQQDSAVTPPAADIKFKDDKSRKAAENYLRNRGVSNYGELTNTQKAEYTRIAAGNTGGGGQGRRSSGSSTTSGDTIDYKREYSLEDARKWEADEDYQAFLKYMRANPNSPEAKQWMDYIQSEIANSGSSYKLNGFDNWSRLAEDGKIGPVHQATKLAANRFKARNTVVPDVQLNEFDPNIDYNNEVNTDEINAAIEAANNNPNTPSTTTQQASRLRYKPTWQRDVPIWAGLAGAAYGMAGSPDYTNADAIIAAAREAGVPINIPVQTIGDYRTRRPFDERYLVNMANQNRAAGERTLRNTSGGNRAMDILGASALAFNNQQELGEIMRQAYLANRQDDAQVAEFNRGTNLYNMQATNQRNMTQAHLNSQRQLAALSGLERGYATRQAIKDAWDAATMESLNSAIASIGLKGRENEQDNMLTSMAEQGYSPFYWGDRGIMQFLPRTSAKKGGKLNKKKRRF